MSCITGLMSTMLTSDIVICSLVLILERQPFRYNIFKLYKSNSKKRLHLTSTLRSTLPPNRAVLNHILYSSSSSSRGPHSYKFLSQRTPSFGLQRLSTLWQDVQSFYSPQNLHLSVSDTLILNRCSHRRQCPVIKTVSE